MLDYHLFLAAVLFLAPDRSESETKVRELARGTIRIHVGNVASPIINRTTLIEGDPVTETEKIGEEFEGSIEIDKLVRRYSI